ncbi:hypothetical protein QAD02_015623 [Eretmocerus hayati]|uniref:Uncharacterized protein n=1 Tax=Eretmocerus hayati TaxID=131215 RepID=A0ACC2P8R7_9HYME|nr:hypothetical protein QAD02_015623 [Eretmocerus hayati]
MLCCVSRKAAGGSGGEESAAIARCRASAELSRFVDVCREIGKGPHSHLQNNRQKKNLHHQQQQQNDGLSRLDEAVLDVARLASSFAPRVAAAAIVSPIIARQDLPRNLDTLTEEGLNCSPGAPQRSNEKGQCPTCQRHFGLKSYDRHVAFCRERATRLPSSPQANYSVAKERLDARMKYRAPALRNRNKPIITNREKYSPGHNKSVANTTSSAPASSHANTGRTTGVGGATNGHHSGHKEMTRSVGNNGSCESPLGSPKLPLLKRTNKESPVSNSGPLKSRPIDRSNSLLRRSFERLPRCEWNSYVRRHPDFSMILGSRIGSSKDYNPFLLAEQQFNELFSDTLSDRSSTCTSDGSSSLCPSQKQQHNPPSPSLSSCSSHATPTFLPNPTSNGHKNHQNSSVAPPQPPPRQPTTVLTTVNGNSTNATSTPITTTTNNNNNNNNNSSSNNNSKPQQQQKRGSVIAPPTAFNDLTPSELSSDVDTAAFVIQGGYSRAQLGRRRILVDATQALGGGEFAPRTPTIPQTNNSNISKQLATPTVERKMSSSSSSGGSSGSEMAPNTRLNAGSHNNYGGSLSSLASDPELKRSNSLFDELLLGFESDCTLPSLLMSGMAPETNNCASFVISSSSSCSSRLMPNNGFGGHQRRVNGKSATGGMRRVLGASDDDFGDDDDEEVEPSSPDSLKRPKCNTKLSADSAYSSLNRKQSIGHGRSTNDMNTLKNSKLSKFCHECGDRFPDSANFCCQCGAKRLSI